MTEPAPDIELSSEACDHCDMVYSSISHTKEGKKREWSCVGLMKGVRRPNNIHDLVNKIRLCIENPLSSEGLTLFEWTPWEANTISLLLNMGVNQYLSQDQPTNHIIGQLEKLGITDDPSWDIEKDGGKTEK